MTASGALGVALVGRGFTAAVHRAAWSTAEAWTGVPAHVVLETRCWEEAMSHPGVDVVHLCGPAPDNLLDTAAAAASAGRHLVIGDRVIGDLVIGDPMIGEVVALRPGPAGSHAPAGQSAGLTVAGLPHRCVPAVRLARQIVASGDIGAPRHVGISGPVGLAVVDLVHTLTGRRFAAAAHVPERGRLDGLLDGACTVAVQAGAPQRDPADVRVELSGSDGTVRLDLRRPLTVDVVGAGHVARRLRAPVTPHPYPAVFGPPGDPGRARVAAEHLVVDAVEVVAHGRADIPCLGDVIEASRVLGHRLEAGREVAQRGGFLDDPVPAQLTGA